ITRPTLKIIAEVLPLDWITRSRVLLAPAAHECDAKNQTAGNTVQRHGVLPQRKNRTATSRIDGWRIVSWPGLRPGRACAALPRVKVASRNNRKCAGLRRWDRDGSLRI